MGVLAFAAYRFGPQVGAALGVGGGHGPLGGSVIRTMDGEVLSVQSLKGSVVLVNVWATWCPPCVLEMPGFQDVYEEYGNEGFTVIGISRDTGDPARVRTFLRERGITYPIAMARDVELAGLDRVESLPTSFLIDRGGTIRHRVVGFFAEPALRLAVRRLLSEEDDQRLDEPE
jgi:thiol-disulfide isomerase/thioredoxin